MESPPWIFSHCVRDDLGACAAGLLSVHGYGASGCSVTPVEWRERPLHRPGHEKLAQVPAASAAGVSCENLPREGLNNSDLPSGGQNVVAKLLISNAAAGSIIGKVGVRLY
jgi:hypothetical protein